MFNISRSFIGLEDTALRTGTRLNENKESNSISSTTLPSWAKDIKIDNEKTFEDYDRPLFK